MPSFAITCCSDDPSRHAYATSLAQQLHLPLASSDSETFSYLLTVTDTHLELRQPGNAYTPIYVDFLSRAAEYRRLRGGGKQQLIARAVGIKGSYRPTVIDATAGLGEDGYVLACLGCQVHYLERSPIIAALLQDGLQRLYAQSPNPVAISLTVSDAIDYLTVIGADDCPDVIYLDPMFPIRSKTALAKKSMRLLRDIVGYDEDASALLDIARQQAIKRVVVKRPRLAPKIDGPSPSLVFNGQSSRFDVYLSSNLMT